MHHVRSCGSVSRSLSHSRESLEGFELLASRKLSLTLLASYRAVLFLQRMSFGGQIGRRRANGLGLGWALQSAMKRTESTICQRARDGLAGGRGIDSVGGVLLYPIAQASRLERRCEGSK